MSDQILGDSNKPELQRRLEVAGLGLTADDFHYHATDLYVVNKAGVMEWLQANYEFVGNIQRFIGAKGSPWEAKSCLDIPFAGIWPSK